MDKRIDDFFRAHADEMVSDICSLIAIKSVNGERSGDMPFGEGPYKALCVAAEIGRRIGFEPVNFDNYVVRFNMNGKEPALGILAHLDVVPEGEGWSVPPYEGTVRDGKLYGRGAADDKGPAIAALYALKAATEIEPALSKDVRLILGTDEETGSTDIEYYRAMEKLPPFVFSPDAEYPVINVEKGRYAPVFEANFEEKSALPRCISFAGGHTANIVPQYAKAEIEGIEELELSAMCKEYSKKTGAEITFEIVNGVAQITAKGKSAHASTPEEGINAQTALLALLAALPLADGKAARIIGKLALLFPHGDTEGKAFGIAQADGISGALTLNFSKLTINKTGLRAQFDCRCPICGADTLCGYAEQRLKAEGMEIAKGREMSKPHCTPADSQFVKTLLEVYEDYTGNKGECIAIGGGTYVHNIDGGVAFGCTMPGTDNHMHGADEFAVIDELILSAKMFTQVILELCK